MKYRSWYTILGGSRFVENDLSPQSIGFFFDKTRNVQDLVSSSYILTSISITKYLKEKNSADAVGI